MKKNFNLFLGLFLLSASVHASNMDCRSTFMADGVRTDLRIQIVSSADGLKAIKSMTSKDSPPNSESKVALIEGPINQQVVSSAVVPAKASELEKLFHYIGFTRSMLNEQKLNPEETPASRMALINQFDLGFPIVEVVKARAYQIGNAHPLLGVTYLVEAFGANEKTLGRFIYSGFVTYKCMADSK